jgi:hypothetical protein
MTHELIDHDCDGTEDKRWVKRRKKRVTDLLQRLRNGDKDTQSLTRLTGSIEQEWGGIERFGQAWVQSVKASREDGPGAAKTLTAFRDMAKVYIGISGANRGDIDLSEVDDETLNKLDVMETLVQLLLEDSWILRDIIGMVPAFDDEVLVAILKERGYAVVGAESIVEADSDDQGSAS